MQFNNSQKISLDPPRGLRDFYPDDMRMRNAIFGAWTSAAREFGFAQYDACVVENLALFKRKSGEEIVDQIYTFEDKSGRELALRPEMTPSFARMVTARQNGLTFPLKWFAIAQCFRYERMSKGRKREHYQWNLDIVGEESASAEAETIACAVRSLELMGLNGKDFIVRFSSRALLSALLIKTEIPEHLHQAVFLALDKRGKIGDAEITALLSEAGLSDKNISAVFEMMNIRAFPEAADTAGRNLPCVKQVETFIEALSHYGLQNIVEFDISVVRGLGYYTGIVFEAFDTGGKFRALFGGGRYDNLLGDLGGKPATAVGLGFGDVVIAELLADKDFKNNQPETEGMAIGYMQTEQQAVARRIAADFRAKGVNVDFALSPEKARRFFSRADKTGFQKAVYIGPDDIEKGSIKIKNLANGTEEEAPLPSSETKNLDPLFG